MRPVLAHGGGDLKGVGPHLFAEVRDLVDKGDLRGKEGVGGVFDHLCRLRRSDDHRLIGAGEHLVKLPQQLLRPLAGNAQHDAVGVVEIAHRAALPQKFGVGGHIKGDILPHRLQALRNALAQGAGGTHRTVDLSTTSL